MKTETEKCTELIGKINSEYRDPIEFDLEDSSTENSMYFEYYDGDNSVVFNYNGSTTTRELSELNSTDLQFILDAYQKPVEPLEEQDKEFLYKDLSGRGFKNKLDFKYIATTWDLSEQDDNGESLRKFLKNCELGDTWETADTFLECISE